MTRSPLIDSTVFLCGAVVMSFEILGSRVLAPNFGTTIFVWGSLISVFLAGLAAGYFLGGKLADRNPSAKGLALVIMIPALLFISFPLYHTAVTGWIFRQDMGERISPLVASLALFFIPSVLLGAVSPYAVKLRTCSLSSVGHTVGTLYSLSTTGSIAGTLATSFYLIAVAGVNTLIFYHGALLLLIAAPLLITRFKCPAASLSERARPRTDGDSGSPPS